MCIGSLFSSGGGVCQRSGYDSNRRQDGDSSPRMDWLMPIDSLTPLRFAPLFKTALWGGARLRPMLGAPQSSEITGEAWLLSDQGDNQSVVSTGAWAGTTLRQLLQRYPE